MQTHLWELIDKIEMFAIGHRKLDDPEAKEGAVCKLRQPEGQKLFVGRTSGGRQHSRLAYLHHPLVPEAQDGETSAGMIRDAALQADPDFVHSEEIDCVWYT